MSRNKYPEQTVEKILDAAACLFAQKGYAHTTLQDVIDETGLSKGAVYHHFKSKEEIAAKVGDRMGAEFTATLAHIRDDDAMTGLQKLQAVFAASLLPQRQQALGRALPRLWDDPQFLSIELHDLLEKTIPIYITPMIQQGTTDGSIHTADAAALGGSPVFTGRPLAPPADAPYHARPATGTVRGVPPGNAGDWAGSADRGTEYTDGEDVRGIR